MRVASSGYVRPVDLKKLEFIQSHLKAFGARSVLELGCGQGLILQELSGLARVGVEISDDEAAIARTKALDVRVGHAGRYDAGRTFDAVIASEVIEHMIEPQSLLANAARHLRQGGLLILTTPNGFGWYEMTGTHLNPRAYLYRSNALRKLRGKPPYQRGDSFDHCQWFTMGRLRRMFREAGLELVKQENSDFISGTDADVKLASRLPHWLASGWYFALRKA